MIDKMNGQSNNSSAPISCYDNRKSQENLNKLLTVFLLLQRATAAFNMTEDPMDVEQGSAEDFGRVVNGRPVEDISEIPFIVKLYVHYHVIKKDDQNDEDDESDKNDVMICGGSIIDPYNVLTAAHCVHGHNVFRVDIVAGTSFFDKEKVWRQRAIVKTIESGQITIHPDYKGYASGGADIALLSLENQKPFKLGKKQKRVKRVMLPRKPSERRVNPKACRVAGWGDTKECGNGSPILRKAWIPWFKDEACEKLLGRDYIRKKMICAGYTKWTPAEDIKDGCQGDSDGGPYVCWNPYKKQYVQVGVVSWGYGCAIKRNPGLYARVDNYIKWIDQEMYVPPATTEWPEPPEETTRRRKDPYEDVGDYDRVREPNKYKVHNDRHARN